MAAALTLTACSNGVAPTPSPTPTQTGVASPTPSLPGVTPSPSTEDGPVAVPDPPERDWVALVESYRGHEVEPLPSSSLYRNETVGTQQTFWIIDLNRYEMVPVPATLTLVGDTALWYTADALRIDRDDLADAARSFDDTIFPQVKETFAPGAEIPGRITILNANLPGLGGYFSAADAQPASAYRFSNERMMMVMNGTGSVGSRSYLGTLAHELQHLVQWHVDPTEHTWVSEGTAEFAATALGLPALPYQSFFGNPSVSLANWPEDPGASLPAYAGASLFISFLVSQTGVEAIDRLVSEPMDGTDGVGAYLQATIGREFGSFFGDWLVANHLRTSSGRYAYEKNIPWRIEAQRAIDGPGEYSASDLAQLSGAYLTVDPDGGPLHVTFDGDEATPAIPVAAHSGNHCWWGNRGDSIDSTLTREIDLTGETGATLEFWTWYDIENAYDYGYVAASTDGGASWQALQGTRTTEDDPFGSSLGPAYSGRSDGWVEEHVDLGRFAGQRILVRFQYLTDESVNNAGWCIDDIAVPEIGFIDDAEAPSGWDAAGFVRVPNTGIPQDFVLRTVQGEGDDAIVTDHPLDDNNNATFVIDETVTVIVGSLTPRTSQPASFALSAERR